MKPSNRRENGQRMLQQLAAGHADTDGSSIVPVFPDFWKMHLEHLFGEVWSRPKLALRERIMVNLTGLIFHKFHFGILNCMRWALNNGIKREEILELILHVTYYAGWPCGVNAIEVAKEVLPPLDKKEKLAKDVPEEPEPDPEVYVEKGQRILDQLFSQHDPGEREDHEIRQVFPDFWEMMQGHLFGEIWSRPGLALRERIVINLTAQIFHKFNSGIASSMRWAINNGITREEILEIVMHVAHYGGWPCGVNAIEVAKQVFAEKD